MTYVAVHGQAAAHENSKRIRITGISTMTEFQPPSQGVRHPVFELKAAGFTLPIIRLFEADIDAVAAELGARVEQAPEFFHNTPVVIDLSAFASGSLVEFPNLVGLLRGYGMIPFGVRGGTKAQHAAAEAMELAILSDHEMRVPRTGRPGETPAPTTPPPDHRIPDMQASERRGEAPRNAESKGPGQDGRGGGEETASRHAGATFTLVTRPVRSGQRVYAAGGDLSVIAPVSAGAELMADGNIHVYGPLRGRALAGMRGNTDARIFCQDLQAELVSVAGNYRISENIPAELRGIPVQIFLEQKTLRIEKL